ncbi:MAG: efflux RND transporter permease subunit [candidate division KSB1 bacterium]|nr:efflux RND transporter permease subunit [candidate division KSB1 bacterium]
MKLVEFSIRRRVTISMLFLAGMVFGLVGLRQLPIDLLPNISYPAITIRTEYPGTAPAEVENLITKPIEEAVSVVSGVVEVTSVSRPGLSEVVVEFDWNTNMDFASLEVREKLDLLNLPRDASKPVLYRFDPSLDPIMRIGLYGEGSLVGLRLLAEKRIKQEIESLAGVAAVKVSGGLEEEIHVLIDEPRLAQLNLPITLVVSRLAQENIDLTGGRLKDGQAEYLVRTLNQFVTPDEMNNIVIARRNGVPIYLRDVARVQKSHKDRSVVTRINGREAVEVAVYKEADANTVSVARRVKQKLAELNQELSQYSGGARMQIVSDQSRFIQQSINDVLSTAVTGGLLAVIVLYLFLRNWGSTAIIGLAIPISVVVTFFLMYVSKISLNIMSLGGLALGIGMLVDNSIVVLESIDRHRSRTPDRVRASIEGTSEVGRAVIASTLTTVCVFVPIIFVKGIAGQLFSDQALTVTYSLTASLLVALTIIPMLSALSVGPGAGAELRRIVDQTERQGMGLGVRERALPAGLAAAGAAAVWAGLVVFLRGGLVLALAGLVPVSFTAVTIWYWPTFAATMERRSLVRRLRPAGVTAAFVLCVLFLLRAAGVVRLGWSVVTMVTFLMGLAAALAGGLRHAWTIYSATAMRTVSRLGGIVLRGLEFLLRPVQRAFDASFGAVRNTYPMALNWALTHRGKVLALILGLLVASLFALRFVGTELIPEMSQGEFYADVKLPAGTPLETTDRVLLRMATMAMELPEMETVYTVAGASSKSAFAASEERENIGQISFRLRPGMLGERELRAMNRVRDLLSSVPGVEMKFSRPTLFSLKTPIEVEIAGYNLQTLEELAKRVANEMSQVEGLRDIKSSTEGGNPEIQIIFDRDRLAALGLDIATIASQIRGKIQGEVATSLRRQDRKIDVRVRATEEVRESLNAVANLTVNAPGGTPVPLTALARITAEKGPAEIRRVDQQRVAVVSANVVGRDLGSAVREVQERLSRIPLPADFSLRVAGQSTEMAVSFGSMRFALLLAVFLVYLVMASQFESLIHPFVILFTIPFGLIGVVWSLLLTGQSVSVVVLIGGIVLAGIVVNNAIVLIDYANQLRARGVGKIEALKQAGQVRLRPILMTTTTTVLGLLPMTGILDKIPVLNLLPLSLGGGEGVELRAPLAITVMGGLIFGTILTLLVIPTVYATLDRKP